MKRKPAKKRPKAPKYTIIQVLEGLNGVEKDRVGKEVIKGNEKAQAVVAQFVWYMRFPQDKRREKLLVDCFEKYKRSVSPLGGVESGEKA